MVQKLNDKPHEQSMFLEGLGMELALRELNPHVELKEESNGAPSTRPVALRENVLGSNSTILLVDDDSIDVMTVKRAFKELNIENPLSVACNGTEALVHLENQERMPCMILLDLNMPKMNGVEFLKIFKKNSNYENIPVVVLTTSKGDQDRLDCRELGVS